MIGGGAGSGKTSGLLAASAAQSANPRHRAVIFRRDYPSLRHIISASYALFLPLRATYNKAEHCWTFPRGATIEFAHLEDETAIYQHAGKEYSFIGFDELQQLPGDSVDSRGQPINSAFSFMQSRLRAAKDSGLRLEIRCTATPGGVGMVWVKNYFRIPDSGESAEFVDEVTGFRRAYFKSTVADNPALAGTDYERQLLDLPEAQRKALLLGDWSSYVGQVFEEWNYKLHTCDPFPVPDGLPIWRGADDGFRSPACCLWFLHDAIHDRIFVVNELYQRGLTPEELSKAVLEIDTQYGGGLDGVIDSASFANIGLGSESGKGGRADIMNLLGCRWQPAEKGDGSRIAGKSLVHARLAPKGDGWPGLVITRNCRNLIRELPALCYGKRNPEDVDTDAPDHSYDALRYGLSRKKFRYATVPVFGI
jgi:Terminase large subunit, T4likevirus-type, N-terminal